MVRFLCRMVLLATGCLCVPAQPTLTEITFAQLDWYDSSDNLVQANSSNGVVSWTYDPDIVTYYLNVGVSLNNTGPALSAIQNLPLSAVDNGDFSPRSVEANFNILDLGLPAGTALNGIYFGFSVDSTILGRKLDAPTFTSVLPSGRRQCPCSGESKNSTSVQQITPASITNAGECVPWNVFRYVKGVQEGKKQCMAGSVARSLDWLNRKYKLGSSKDVEDIYNDFVGEGLGDTVKEALVNWVLFKNEYAKQMSNNKIVTKVWGTNDLWSELPPASNIPVDTGDFLTWLENEIPTEDVELGIDTRKCVQHHQITLVSVFKCGDAYYVVYRDDARQGPGFFSFLGDLFYKMGRIEKVIKTNEDGEIEITYEFVGWFGRGQIIWAFSESVELNATSDGDPHMTNIRGEKFDIARPGRIPFVVVGASTRTPKASRHRFLSQ